MNHKVYLLALLGCIAGLRGVVSKQIQPTAINLPNVADKHGEVADLRLPRAVSLPANYVAIGYDLLQGNPEGDFSHGGLDPGLQLARRVLKFTYANGNRASYNGQLVSIPDQVNFQTTHSCSSAQKVNAYSGTASYQRKLDTKIAREGSGGYGLASFRFSLSAGYSSAQAGTSATKRVMIDKEVVCNVGRARYLLDTALNNHYSIADDFYYAVKNLPATYDEDEYMRFIQMWGTHIIVSATMGGRQVERYRYSYAEMYEYASSHVSGSVSTGGSYAGYSGSLSVDINSFNEQVSSSAAFQSHLYNVNSGSTIVKTSSGHYEIMANDPKAPVPILMTLKSITTALDPRLWTSLPESGQTYTSLNIAAKLSNLERALRGYPVWSRASASSDTRVVIPNAWPDGTYSLPKPRSGCPSGGNQFSWHEGYRYHDTEDRNSNNQFSNPLMLAGYFARNNIRVYYCTKTDHSHDYGIPWPRGSYCIAKKGNCPSGFGQGSIYWDDEDNNNANGYGGIIPDGSYGRNTLTYFCCRNDGFATNPIILPRDRPFYLYRKHRTDGCQRVSGMSYRQEYVRWDNEDRNNADRTFGDVPYEDGGSENHRLYYCYYY